MVFGLVAGNVLKTHNSCGIFAKAKAGSYPFAFKLTYG